MYFQIYQIKETGAYQLVEQVDKVFFEISKDNNAEWKPRYWGNIRLNDFEEE